MGSTPLTRKPNLPVLSIVRFRTPLLMLVLMLAIGACGTPAQRFDVSANQLGLTAGEIKGDQFRHRFFSTPGNGEVLHIYLGGDGSPWLVGGRIASDPTPRRPVLPALMAADPAPAVYLGRPCYHGHTHDRGCTAWLWTHGRYSPAVIDSLAAATTKLVVAGNYRGVDFIGHSGGGALAMLLAAVVPDTRAVVTLAGNLDVGAWSSHHGYTPLTGSLDPASRPPLPDTIAQLHVLAGADTVVPPKTQLAVLSRISGCLSAADARQCNRSLPEFTTKPPGMSAGAGVTVWTINGADHRCCWGRLWPRVLQWLQEHDQFKVDSSFPPESSSGQHRPLGCLVQVSTPDERHRRHCFREDRLPGRPADGPRQP